MTFVSSHTNVEALTQSFVAEFEAAPDRVWLVWEDPRKLELWWGPPEYPATFHHHNFIDGGQANYYMTGPDGDKFHGWMRFIALDKPNRIDYEDGFADDEGNPVEESGSTRSVLTLEKLGEGTRMTIVTVFESVEQLEQMAEMGVEEGMRLAMGQIDALLVEGAG